MMNKVIVTGAGGMLGENLLSLLNTDMSWNVYAISSQVNKLNEKYHDSTNIKIYDSFEKITCKDIDVFINCGFPRNNNPQELVDYINNFERILTIAETNGVKHFVNISSQSVYPQNQDKIQVESDNLAPGSIYGFSKYTIEKLMEVMKDKYKFTMTNIRLGSLINENFDQRIINRLIINILNNEDIVVNDGTSKVSFLYVNDAAIALKTLMENLEKLEKMNVFNIGNDDYLSFSDIATICIKVGQDNGYMSSNLKVERNNTIYNNTISSLKFSNLFDWKSQYKMSEIIKHIFHSKENENCE